MIRVRLPYHLRKLAGVESEIQLSVAGTPSQRAVIDALEAAFPQLRGTIRDPITKKRRPFVRFYACEQDLSHQSPDASLPEAVIQGLEAFHVVGAMAGGWARRLVAPATFGARERERPGCQVVRSMRL